MEEIISTRVGLSSGQRPAGELWQSSMNFTELPSARDKWYWKARRSLRIWPIRGEGGDTKTAILTFLASKLRLGEDVIADAEDSHIVRVPAGKGVVKHEVVVEFSTVDLRDIVRRSAYNLAGESNTGIRLEVPHHLMKNFKALEAASYKLKQKYKGLKRNIKFDDEVCDLALEFRLHTDAPWKKLRPDQAKEMQRIGGEAEEVSAVDVASLLGEDTGGEEEEENGQ